MIDQQSPAQPSAAVLAMRENWDMIDALLDGTGAMRAAGETYLPKHVAESREAYQRRLKVSTLYNAFRRTCETLSAKPFDEPVKLGDDVPPALVEYADNIDLEGRDLHAFAHEVFLTALSHGLSHILVDYPQTQAGQTLADQRLSGARPYFVHVRPENILGWRSERISGVETLTQLRIMERVEEPDGRWATVEVEQVRVYDSVPSIDGQRSVVWTTYRKDAKGEWLEFESGNVSIGVIPLVTVYGARTGFMTARPPLLDLAFLNVEHWQSASDQSNILTVARVPILFAAGFAEGALKISPHSAIENEDPQAKLAYVEHSGAAIGAGAESLKALEERMSVMGAQLLLKRKTGTATATEKAIDSADADSALGLMALDHEDALEQALQLMAMWEGLEDGGTVEVETDVGIDLEDMDLPTLINAREFGILSSETIFSELQRRGVVSEELTWEEERARLIAEGPPAGIAGSFETPTPGGQQQPMKAAA